LETITHKRLGKTLLVTDHLSWSPAPVIEAYRTLSAIEQTFKKMKHRPVTHFDSRGNKAYFFYSRKKIHRKTLNFYI
jgi:hypothetical protein